MLGCGDSCRCKRCELKFRDIGEHKYFKDDRPVSDACIESKNGQKEHLPDHTQSNFESYKKEEYNQSHEDSNEKSAETKSEPDITQAYRMMRTTNQEYGMWNYDPLLRNKDWYKAKRFPIKSSFMTRLVHESITGYHV